MLHSWRLLNSYCILPTACQSSTAWIHPGGSNLYLPHCSTEIFFFVLWLHHVCNQFHTWWTRFLLVSTPLSLSCWPSLWSFLREVLSRHLQKSSLICGSPLLALKHFHSSTYLSLWLHTNSVSQIVICLLRILPALELRVRSDLGLCYPLKRHVDWITISVEAVTMAHWWKYGRPGLWSNNKVKGKIRERNIENLAIGWKNKFKKLYLKKLAICSFTTRVQNIRIHLEISRGSWKMIFKRGMQTGYLKRYGRC